MFKYATYACDLNDKMSISGVKLEGKATEAISIDKTCGRTIAELMFYHGIACAHPI